MLDYLFVSQKTLLSFFVSKRKLDGCLYMYMYQNFNDTIVFNKSCIFFLNQLHVVILFYQIITKSWLLLWLLINRTVVKNIVRNKIQ